MQKSVQILQSPQSITGKNDIIFSTETKEKNIENSDKNEKCVVNSPNNIEEDTKEKRRIWKSWSTQEKIMFYQIIANAGNKGNLSNLFKLMNEVSKFIIICV